uniref:Uncharacterized protein n=1 Tax=Panagrolaimus sp. JU765 TaxID=591449 RepID=A0AC34PVU3_9BILA
MAFQEQGVKGSIDKEYLTALQEAKEDEADLIEVNLEESAHPGQAEKGKAKKVNPRSLDAVVAKMPWQKRMFFYAMSDEKKKQLSDHANARQRYVCRGVQTDDSLMKGGIVGSVGEPRYTSTDGDHGKVLWIQKQ